MRIISEEPKLLFDPATKRRKKALQIFESGHVACMDKIGFEFKVKSQTVGFYTVRYSADLQIGRCTCPDYAYSDTECKHILAARYFRHEMGYV